MQYMCLVYQEESGLANVPEAELEKVVGECIAFTRELERTGHHVMSSGLQTVSTATTLRRRNGKLTVSDGPFAETKEVLGGFTIIEARDLNEALQIASKFPAGVFGSIEVRPVMDPFQDYTDPMNQKLATCVRRAIRDVCEPAATS